MAQGEWLFDITQQAVHMLPDLSAMTPWQWTCAAAGHLSFALSAASYMTTDLVRLRVLSVVAVMLGIFFNATLESGPLWISVMWLTLFLATNLFRLATGHLERVSPALSSADVDMRDRVFPGMRAKDWLAVKAIANVATYQNRQVVAGGDVCVVIEGRVQDAATGSDVNCWGSSELLGLEATASRAVSVLVGRSDRVVVLRMPTAELRALVDTSEFLKLAVLEGLMRAAAQNAPSDARQNISVPAAANDALVVPVHA